jgi:hypothetical protein
VNQPHSILPLVLRGLQSCRAIMPAIMPGSVLQLLACNTHARLFDTPPVVSLCGREKGMPDVLGTLNQVLSDRPFLEGEEFTVGDVAVGAYLLYIPLFFPTVSCAQFTGRQTRARPSPLWGSHPEALAGAKCVVTKVTSRSVTGTTQQSRCSNGAAEICTGPAQSLNHAGPAAVSRVLPRLQMDLSAYPNVLKYMER